MGRTVSMEINIGDQFGHLTVEKFGGLDSHRNRFFVCRCDCGNRTMVRATEIFKRSRMSCGCQRTRRKAATQSGNLLSLLG